MVVIEAKALQNLLHLLNDRGYTTLGPTVQDQAIVYDRLDTISDLPIGWSDSREGGKYRLTKRPDQAYFGYTVGPQSWKKFLLPPKVRLWSARKNGSQFSIEAEQPASRRYAFVGVRPCELKAILIQDRVLSKGDYVDPHYQSGRKDLFIVAVNCLEPGANCFCASMNSGPQAGEGYDLVLTEIIQHKRHFFLVESGSERGGELMRELPGQPASEADQRLAGDRLKRAAKQMGRTLETGDLKELLYDNLESSHWEAVGDRCLSCANCTMVCPTCFCTTVEDATDLTGTTATRTRRWDSCFTIEFSYIHGGSVRTSGGARYRQWITHKLASWQDQFDSLGCVGCGRCITWCPVGIDITEEVQSLRRNRNGQLARSENTESKEPSVSSLNR